MTATRELLQQLMQRESVTPEDAGCMDIILGRLQKKGFEATWLDSSDTRNIWLRKGHKPPLLAFLGHTDVVPPGPLEEWDSPPFEPTIRNGYLYGRGAADMKSGIAAFVIACDRFCANFPEHQGSIALLITSDEEGIATHGTIKVIEYLEQRNEKIDWCLVGEPSSSQRIGDTIRIGRRGSLCGKLRILGIQGHVAYPDLAENPVHQFAPLLTTLTQEIWDQGNQYFPPTSFQISNIHAGTGAENIIPGRLDVDFNFRFSTELTEDAIKHRMNELLSRHNLRYEIDWRLSGKPFLTRETELLDAAQQALVEVTGQKAAPKTDGGTSDGRFVAPTGAQVIELGPSNETIHKINERIHLEDLETLTDVYQKTIEYLLINN